MEHNAIICNPPSHHHQPITLEEEFNNSSIHKLMAKKSEAEDVSSVSITVQDSSNTASLQ